jgi:hypothetical protein
MNFQYNIARLRRGGKKTALFYIQEVSGKVEV